MPRYAAFLRGINISNRRVKNDALRLCCEEMGFARVAIFRASGNVILGTDVANGTDEMAHRIEAGLADSLGYEVPVFLRTATQVRAIAKHEPFDAKLVEVSGGKLQVALLPGAPRPPTRKQALSLAGSEDRLAIRGRELYWLPSGGISESKLDLKGLESLLGPWTMRTKGTIEQIVAKHFAI
jgi:uncharacterized protein (DUF1697 family)